MGAFFDTLYMLWNQIVYAIANGGISDIIDIAVIAYVIYQGIVFLRESRAGQLVKGLVILFLVFVIAKWWNLVTIQWALSKAIDFIIIAAAVIFQPELRRILERVGRTKLTAGQLFDERESAQSESIDKICKAAGFMQEKKIGALIVFERETQLGEIINTGTIVDAATSVSVVNNIFFPKSPLHDGAVIVRNGRIYAAGCILPLSQLDLSSSSMGTRHRAAIGMSENSDAVVLVVSEETGTISIAEGGNITRNYNAVTAAAELRRLLLDNENQQKSSPVVKVLKNINPFKKNQ
ncbi:MAG: diadenylate cyclase CdaA [Clostridia bacterium]|nr:diadenylate cyclase CdaA [Clostridia bacterium]MBQ3058097.1 diadenylate cyclase CdaA [Clostridia bacterium]